MSLADTRMAVYALELCCSASIAFLFFRACGWWKSSSGAPTGSLGFEGPATAFGWRVDRHVPLLTEAGILGRLMMNENGRKAANVGPKVMSR